MNTCRFYSIIGNSVSPTLKKTVDFFLDTNNLLLIALAVLSGGTLLFQSLQARGSRLSTLQATQMLNKGKTLVLDVRTVEQFATGHLSNAVNIPIKDLAQRTGEIDKFKDKNVIIVDQNGSLGGKAESRLRQASFANVFYLQGGIAAWQSQSLPVTTSKGK